MMMSGDEDDGGDDGDDADGGSDEDGGDADGDEVPVQIAVPVQRKWSKLDPQNEVPLTTHLCCKTKYQLQYQLCKWSTTDNASCIHSSHQLCKWSTTDNACLLQKS